MTFPIYGKIIQMGVSINGGTPLDVVLAGKS
jgi:hypothetical protein